jgi:hypothetical protein
VRNVGQIERVRLISEGQDTSIRESIWQQISEPQYTALVVHPRLLSVAVETMHSDNTLRSSTLSAVRKKQEEHPLDDWIASRNQLLQAKTISLNRKASMFVLYQI